MAKFIMIQGTSSHAGKSLIVAGLCRILKRMGFNVAPFKSQNMALNSGVVGNGLEMGRAQIFQAEAAGIEPTVEMNPILLKPSTDVGSQVIVMGKPIGNMSAVEYYRKKRDLLKVVLKALDSLSKRFDVIIIEGAGSPAEINLKAHDIVNMGLAREINSPVIIVGDIDRGGVFASLYGTYLLLDDAERKLVKGFIINKFRGDKVLLQSGLSMLESMTGVPVIGVVPYIKGLLIDDEDSVSLEDMRVKEGDLKISVIRLPRISNFTDFHPFLAQSGVQLEYVNDPLKLIDSHLIIIPGSKNTLYDLRFIKEEGFDLMLKLLHKKGVPIFGICGGYQMLGEVIEDNFGVEGGGREEGLGFVKARTILSKDKTLTRVEGYSLFPEKKPVKGYEIHMGVTEVEGNPMVRIEVRNGRKVNLYDGYCDGLVFGTYIHGIFDSDEFRSSFLNFLSKGRLHSLSYRDVKEKMMDMIADTIRNSIDMDAIMNILEGG